MEKKLQQLLELLPGAEIRGNVERLIMDITADSRELTAGSLFICLRGAHVDGHQYLQQAAAQGATAALVDCFPQNIPEQLTLIKVPDTRVAMEKIVPFFYDYPGKKMRVIGVTGTNGKTTTTNIVRHILRRAGYKVGLIGTINIMIEDECRVSHNTTPDVVDLQKVLYQMQLAGCDYVVMEVSSHALALNRVAGIEFDTAVLTNITQDHLDFHKTFANYVNAKGILFEHLHEGVKTGKTAIFNMDDPSSATLAAKTQTAILSFGKNSSNTIYPLSFTVAAKHMQLQLVIPGGTMNLQLQITGEFNVYNVMAAVAVALAEKIDAQLICEVLDGFDGVPGRFQLVEAGQPYTVIVDYAHTPDGLENVLNTARSITKGRLWVVFGCGGDRDNKKRPIMGKIALDLADCIMVTSDNPRSENPEAIIAEIETALQIVPAGKEVYKETDRREAINYVLQHAAAADVVLIAGKGHENYQILAHETIHFDDKEVVKEYWEGKSHGNA